MPFKFRKRGGQKLVVTPDGAPWAPRPRVGNALVKAHARAFRWRKQLHEGVYGSLDDLARAVAPSYVSRVLRLTLPAPDMVKAILDGRQPAGLQLDDLLEGFPLEWGRQRELAPRQSFATVDGSTKRATRCSRQTVSVGIRGQRDYLAANLGLAR